MNSPKLLKRDLEPRLSSRIDYTKAIIVLGPRQVGKTTLVKKIAASLDSEYLYLNGDDPAIQLSWNTPTERFIFQQIGAHKVVVIDEAQRLKNIGLTAKMIIDARKEIQLFISGSSSLELNSEIKEPLTGRKWEYFLYPFSWSELVNHYGMHQSTLELNHRLVMGSYPDVVNHPEQDKNILNQLSGTYLYKDVLEKGGLKKPELLMKILQALAWQVGNEVSYSEIAGLVEVDKNTVSNYIDLLEKAFVIFRLPPLSRNLRNEISSKRKIYFYDNGIRNAIINQLAPIEMRNDAGALWENFLISERLKKNTYSDFWGASYFWRTRESEIDYIEEKDGVFQAFEFKWNAKTKFRFPRQFAENYHPQLSELIHPGNFQDWLV